MSSSYIYVNLEAGRQRLIVAFLFQYWHVYCEQLVAALGAQEPAVVRSSSNAGAPAPSDLRLRKNSSEKHFHTCTRAHTPATSEPTGSVHIVQK